MQNLSLKFVSLFCCLGALFACSKVEENTLNAADQDAKTFETATKKINSVKREVTTGDLFIPFPRVEFNDIGNTGRLSLVDLLGEKDANEVAKHLTLKSPLTALDREEKKEAARFWTLTPNDPAWAPSGRNEPAYKECLENPKNMIITGVRFAPFENVLPGASQDWKLALPASELDKSIQLRFIMQADCSTADASAHVIFNLEPKNLRAKILTLQQSVKQEIGKGTTPSLTQNALTLSALLNSKSYSTWWTSKVNFWLDTVSELRKPENGQILATTLNYPENYLDAAVKKGFDTKSQDLARTALGISEDLNVSFPDTGLSALARADAPAAKAFAKILLKLVREDARLVTVTTFALTGFEVWTFGALTPSPALNGGLAPVSLSTVDTFLTKNDNETQSLSLRKTSGSGTYESSTEYSVRSKTSADDLSDSEFMQSILGPRVPVWSDFGKTNAWIGGDGVYTMSDPRTNGGLPNSTADFIRTMTEVTRTNASNVTCGTCHAATLEATHVSGGARLHMLTDFSDKMNLRTAAELVHEVKKFKEIIKK